MRRLVYNVFGDKELKDVQDFQDMIGCPRAEIPHLDDGLLKKRLEFVKEELEELEESYVNLDLAGVADALIDLVYVIKGTALSLGLPWEELWNDVHRANMTKIPLGETHRAKYDAAKPDDFVPPRTHDIINYWRKHGVKHE